MPFKNRGNDHCGYLDWLNSSNFECKVRRFGLLKHGTPSTLEIYFEKINNESLEREIDLVIDISQTSLVMKYEAEKTTSKNIFYLNYKNDCMYFAAENEHDRDEWCDLISSEILHSATRRCSSEDVVAPLRETPTRGIFDVMGTFLSNRSHSVPAPESNDHPLNFFPGQVLKISDFHTSHVFKTGICNLKIGTHSAWHERYFVLNIDGLFYFKSPHETSLLGFIRHADIVTCRQSNGVFPHLQNIFEVVTRKKVYYCQTDTTEESDGWISVINSNSHHRVKLSLMRQTSSFDDDVIFYKS